MTPTQSWRGAFPYLFTALSLIVLGTACNKSAPTPKEVASQTLAWNLKTTVEAYDKAGVKSAQWDAAARNCMTAYSHLRAKEPGSDEPWVDIIRTNAAVAMDAGCRDPLVTYLSLRFETRQNSGKDELSRRFYAMA